MSKNYLYDKVFSALQEQIKSGQYAYGMLIPSENQLCKQFSVERTTVRKALALLVQAGLLEKRPGVGCSVVYCTESSSFVGPRQGNSIGFFVLESDTSNKKITEPYYADLFYYLEKECSSRDLQLIYTTISENSDIVDIASKHEFIAIVFVTRTPRHLILSAKETGIPILTVNDSCDAIPCIQPDHLSGAFVAMQYLHDMGHRRIALLTGPAGFLATEDKLTGCYKAMCTLPLTIPDELILRGTEWTFQSGYRATEALLKKQVELPTAIFAFNDIMAVGAIRAIQDFGLSVPDDISIIGFDNMEQLQFVAPDLTTIDGNTSYLAKITVDTASKNAFEQYVSGVKIIIPTKLVCRNSVKKIPL